MIDYQKDDFDGNLDEIMKSINKLLGETGDGYEIEEKKEINESKRK